MAKKGKLKDNQNEGGAGGKILTVLIILLILFIWFAILALLVKFDVGGIGSRTLRPLLKDVPVLNRILPDISPEQEAEENSYPYKTLAEAIERIKELEILTDNLTEENNDYAERQLEMQRELDNLRHFEEEYRDFEAQKEAFYREIVYGDKAVSTDEYIKWYEVIDPATAARIYEELVASKQIDSSIVEKATYLSKMEPEEAAAILQEMSSDIDLVCRLLYCMKTATASNILKNMDALFAARVINRMVELDMQLLE